MKKVTVILSMLFTIFAGHSFAQSTTSETLTLNGTGTAAKRPSGSGQQQKPVNGVAPQPGQTGYMKIKMSDVPVSSSKPNETAKPAVKPIAQPVKPKKAIYIKYDCAKC